MGIQVQPCCCGKPSMYSYPMDGSSIYAQRNFTVNNPPLGSLAWREQSLKEGSFGVDATNRTFYYCRSRAGGPVIPVSLWRINWDGTNLVKLVDLPSTYTPTNTHYDRASNTVFMQGFDAGNIVIKTCDGSGLGLATIRTEANGFITARAITFDPRRGLLFYTYIENAVSKPYQILSTDLAGNRSIVREWATTALGYHQPMSLYWDKFTGQLFFSTNRPSDATTNIYKCGHDGGGETLLHTRGTNLKNVFWSIQVDGRNGHLYAYLSCPNNPPDATNGLYRMSLGGLNITKILENSKIYDGRQIGFTRIIEGFINPIDDYLT